MLADDSVNKHRSRTVVTGRFGSTMHKGFLRASGYALRANPSHHDSLPLPFILESVATTAKTHSAASWKPAALHP